jgi:response regulator NasT
MGSHTHTPLSAAQQARLPAARVLIVGADVKVTMALSSMLRSAGHAAIIAATVDEAFVLCATQSFQLAVIDECLAGMSNVQLAGALRDAHALASVFVASDNDPKLVVDALDTGSLGLIVKPLESARVMPALEHVLSRVQELHELHAHAAFFGESPAQSHSASLPKDSLLKRLRRWHQQVFSITSELLNSGNVSGDIDATISHSQSFRHSLRARKLNKDSDVN